MPQTLSFDLSFSEKGGGPILVKAAPLIDGVVLDSRDNYAFDLCLLLATRHTTVWPSPWLFNCECGTPECAGIEDPIALEVGAERVIWSIPESLRPGLNPGLHGEGPLRFEFAKNQYFSELSRVIAAIDAESERRGRRVQLSLWDVNLGGEGLSAEQELAEQLRRMLYMRTWLTWRDRVWHHFDEAHFEMELPNGYVLAISLEQLADCLAGMNDQPLQWTEALGREIEANIAPSLKMGLDAIVERARTLDWPTVARRGFQADRSPKGLEFGAFEHQEEWPPLKFALTTHAERYPRVWDMFAKGLQHDHYDFGATLAKAVDDVGGDWEGTLWDVLVILEDPSQQEFWYQAVKALGCAADAGAELPYPSARGIAQMYRCLELLPNLGRQEPDEGSRVVWALASRLTGVGFDSSWRPLEDTEVARWQAKLRDG